MGRTPQGMVVFVEHAHPGSRVTAEVYKRRKDHAFAKVIDVITKSPYTVEKVCGHFPICRGCKMQDLKYEKQISEKQLQIAHLFRQYDVPVETIIGLAPHTHICVNCFERVKQTDTGRENLPQRSIIAFHADRSSFPPRWITVKLSAKGSLVLSSPWPLVSNFDIGLLRCVCD